MKAIQISHTGTPDVLQYVDVPTPTPQKGEVLIKITAIGVNYGDVGIRKGIYPGMSEFPIIVGFECSGIVEAVGADANTVPIGQRIAAIVPAKAYAEYITVAANTIIPLPDDVDDDEAAAFPITYLTAYHLLHTMAHIEAGQTILSYASAGGVGTAIMQLARLAGANLIGLTSTAEKVRYVKDQGVDQVINYNTEDVLDRVRHFTGGKGVDVVFNSVAGSTFERDFEALAPLGQIIGYGFVAGPPTNNLAESIMTHFMASKGIRAFSLYSVPPARMAESTATVTQWLFEKKIKPFIYERIPLAEAARAHQLLEEGRVCGKLILKP